MMEDLESTIDEMCVHQKKQLLKLGRRIVPRITEEDILQPNDFPELENHPLFRYEEGVLHGLLMAKAAFGRIKRSV